MGKENPRRITIIDMTTDAQERKRFLQQVANDIGCRQVLYCSEDRLNILSPPERWARDLFNYLVPYDND